jgi:hypothetical protein
MLSASKTAFDPEGTNESKVAAVEQEVPPGLVSRILTSPSPACRDSEKYRSNFVDEGEVSHAPFAGEYGMLLLPTECSVISMGSLARLEHTFAASVVKENVASVLMYTLVVEEARYALKQLLGTVVFCALPALSPPELVMGTSTTLLNHLAVGLLQPIEILLVSPATF